MKETRLPTSIKIKPSIWKQAKIQAIQNDVQLSELVEIALQNLFEQKIRRDK